MLSYPINVHTFENKIRKIEPFFTFAELRLSNFDSLENLHLRSESVTRYKSDFVTYKYAY